MTIDPKSGIDLCDVCGVAICRCVKTGDANKFNRSKLAMELMQIARLPMTDQMRDSLREAAEWLRGDYDEEVNHDRAR
jgi:hypothetical protein